MPATPTDSALRKFAAPAAAKSALVLQKYFRCRSAFANAFNALSSNSSLE